MLQKLKILLDSEIDPAFAARARIIFDQVEARRPKKILDVGCGRGFYIKALGLYSFPKEIYGIDTNEMYLRKARKNILDKRIKILNASAYHLPFPNNYFDFVICSEVLEHLKFDGKALREINRVLKDEGVAVITVPSLAFPFLWDPLNWILMRLFNTHIKKSIWFLAGIWADHERLYTKDILIRGVEEQGFTIKKLNYAVHYCWPLSHFLLYGIGKNIIERLPMKSFNRFNFQKNNKSSMLATLFGLPSRLDTKEVLARSSVDIIAVFKKN